MKVTTAFAILLAGLPLVAPTPIKATGSGQNHHSTQGAWNPATAEPSGPGALDALVQRRLPKKFSNRFTFVQSTGPECAVTNTTTEFDAFTIDGSKNKITITSCTTPGLSRGLLTYLRSIGGDIFWSGDTFQTNLLDSSCPSDIHLKGSAWGPIRYFLNVVTYSYTTAFYKWDKWEYLLDWAALHGVNLPLAIGGQEYIWAEVFRDFGLSEEVIGSYFSGPAFHSWQRMGNIHGSWGQNVTQDWLDQQWSLQKKIIQRMVALGMDPVLPGFSGFVPAELHEKIGGPEFIKASAWEGFPDDLTKNSAIDPNWETFQTVQAAFLKKQKELYGGWTSHYYSIDLYNELTPSSVDPGYLKNVTANVVRSLRAIDPQSVWVMQGWLFASDTKDWTPAAMQAYLSGAAHDEMIVLDLASEAIPVWNRTSMFYGHQWVFNTLWDYGENDGMNGALENFNKEVMDAKAQAASAPGTLVGTGITMEGMNQNEIVFEMAMDTIWQTTQISVPDWTKDWITRRYDLKHNGKGSSLAGEAWALLLRSVYNQTDPAIQAVAKSIFDLVPNTQTLVNRTGHHPTKIAWSTSDVVAALDKLVAAAEASPELEHVEAFAYDIVDVARQALLTAGIPLYNKMIASWNTTTPDLNAVRSIGTQIVDLLKDTDAVLATNKNFLLSSWIQDAKSWATKDTTAEFLEFEARNQIVLWGPANYDKWPLDRYASKDWHGIVGTVYATSWQMFTDYLLNTTVAAYNQSTWTHELQSYEAQWQQEKWGQKEGETWDTVGGVVSTIKGAREKWASILV